MRSALFVGVLALAACGDDGGSPGTSDAGIDGSVVDGSIDGPVDAPAGTFTLTSPTITEGAAIPLTHVCAMRGGMNQSPELAWTNPPAGTLSYALVLTDKSNDLVHSVSYDIPAALTGLPANVQKVYAPTVPANLTGMHQTTGYDNNTRGYLGPCPGTMHTYEFALYAISAATLPNSNMGTNSAAAVTAIMANDLGVAKLTGTFTP